MCIRSQIRSRCCLHTDVFTLLSSGFRGTTSLGLNSPQRHQGLFISVFGDGDEAWEDKSCKEMKDYKRMWSQCKRRLQEPVLR